MSTRAVEPTLTPLETLLQENKLLKETIAESSEAVGALETALETAGVAVPAAHAAFGATPAPEDFWSPAVELPAGAGAFIEEYGAIRCRGGMGWPGGWFRSGQPGMPIGWGHLPPCPRRLMPIDGAPRSRRCVHASFCFCWLHIMVWYITSL